VGGPDPAAVAERVEHVRARIAAAGADPEAVTLVAVTKGQGPDAVRAALDAGLADIGENYANELCAKAAAIQGARWHFLGAIQRNKLSRLAPLVACWQGVARAVEAEAIAGRAPGAAVFVEVEVTGAPQRNGCPPAGVAPLVGAARACGLDVRGLMVVAPPQPDAARAAFRTVRGLADDLGLAERSMGMTDDFEVAVAEGSTMVRLGRVLFGERA
jgi:PLP dependent protein